jgi:hypothetical protein
MLRLRRLRSWGILAAGLAVGLAIGGAMTAGVWVGRQSAGGPPGLDLNEIKLKAMATHGGKTFAVATGPVDEEVEGLYTLDFLTGDLQCFVVNTRTAAPGGWFRTNIAKDISIERGREPSYLLVTGTFNMRGAAGNARPSASLVYVVDANTGEVACYSFLWSRAFAAAGGPPQVREMNLVAKWKARALELRE